jgi:hypothetical protein
MACRASTGQSVLCQQGHDAEGASLLDGLCALQQLFTIWVAAFQLAAKRNKLTDDQVDRSRLRD